MAMVLYVVAGFICSASAIRRKTVDVNAHPGDSDMLDSPVSVSANISNIDDINRPYYDLVLAVPVHGGDSVEALDVIDRVRRVYAAYGGCIVPYGNTTNAESLTIKLVFVVGDTGMDEDLPRSGLLRGDIFYTKSEEGWENLGQKTKAMFGLWHHLR